MGDTEHPWPVATRRDAALEGLTKYYTGKKCKWGHVSQRYTSTGTCVACGNKASRAYRADVISLKHGVGMVQFKTVCHRDDVKALQDMADALKQARELIGGGGS